MTDRNPRWHESAIFGLHFDLHIKPGERETGADLDVDELTELLRAVAPDFVQCDTKGHEGVSSWPTQTGTPGVDLVRDSLAIYREATRRLGLPLIAHHSGVWDQEAIVLHPEWAAIGPDGTPDQIATSLVSSYDRERLIPQLEEILGRYGLDGVWVDGENWGARADWSPEAERLFRERTGFVGDLPRTPDDPGWRAWLDFHRQLFREHVLRYAGALHAAHPEATVVSNWMYTLRHPDPLTDRAIDYISGDFTPSFGIEEALPEAAFLDSRGVPWDLMVWAFINTPAGPTGWTLKGAEQLKQEAAVILSRGGVVALYDQPTRRGKHLEWHTGVLAEVSAFCHERRVAEPGRPLSDVLVLVSPAHHYASSDSLFAYSAATDSVRGAAFALVELHETFDLATFEDDLDWSSYSTLVVAEQGDLGVYTERLRHFVENGGNLVLTDASRSGLPEAFLGYGMTRTEQRGWTYVSAGEGTTPLDGNRIDVVRGEAEVLAWAASHDFDSPDAATAAVLRQRHGLGFVTSTPLTVFANYFSSRYPRTRALIKTMISSPGRRPTITTDAPPWLGISLRRTSSGMLLHLSNLNSGVALSPRNVSVEDIAATPPARIELRTEWSPVSVECLPNGTAIAWSHAEGITTIHVDPFAIHVQLRIESV